MAGASLYPVVSLSAFCFHYKSATVYLRPQGGFHKRFLRGSSGNETGGGHIGSGDALSYDLRENLLMYHEGSEADANAAANVTESARGATIATHPLLRASSSLSRRRFLAHQQPMGLYPPLLLSPTIPQRLAPIASVPQGCRSPVYDLFTSLPSASSKGPRSVVIALVTSG